MKVLITEEQLKLIINESDKVKLPKIVNIPSFCGGKISNDGCKKYSDTMASYGTYSNDSGPKHRAKYVYPASMEEVKYNSDGTPVIFVQKLMYGDKNKGRKLKGNSWKRQAAKWYDKYINNEDIKDRKIWNKSKEFFDATEIVRVTPANNHLFTHESGGGDHPYENNNYVNTSAQPSLEAIGNVIGNFSYESTYRDAIHQQIMIDYNSPTASIGMSNHQEGFAIDLPKSIKGTTSPKSPLTLEDSASRVDKVFLFFVFIGPFYGWYPYGADDTVHFTYCKGRSSSDCTAAIGNYALGIKAFKESGDKLPEMLCSGGWEDESINSATYKLGVKVSDTTLKGFNLTRQWCKKYHGGDINFETELETDDETTTVIPPLGSVKIKDNSLIVDMGEMASKIGFNLFKIDGNKVEEVPFKKSSGSKSKAGVTDSSADGVRNISIDKMSTKELIRTGTPLFLKVSRVIGGKIIDDTTIRTETFIFDKNGNVLTGDDINDYYIKNYEDSPNYLDDFYDKEQMRIQRDIDNTYVKPTPLVLPNLPKLDFDED